MLRIKINHNKLSDSPTKDAAPINESSEKNANLLVNDIINGTPICTLISGYRGAGKTSFLNYVKETLKKESEKTVFCKINLARHYSQKDLLRRLIRQLYHSVSESSYYKENRDSQVLKNLDLIHQRTFKEISQTKRDYNDTTVKSSMKVNYSGLIWSLIFTCFFILMLSSNFIDINMAFPIIGVLVSAVKLISDFTSFVSEITHNNVDSDENLSKTLYDDEIADFHFAEILRGLKSKGLRVVFIFDELDKLKTEQSKSILNEMKPHLLSGDASFIVVGGQELFYEYFLSNTKEDEPLFSIFSRHLHVDLLSYKEIKEFIVNDLIENYDDYDDHDKELIDIYLSRLHLQSKFIFRKSIATMRNLFEWENKEAYLKIDTNQSVGGYVDIVQILEEVKKELGQNKLNVALIDSFVSAYLLLIHSVINLEGIFDKEVWDSKVKNSRESIFEAIKNDSDLMTIFNRYSERILILMLKEKVLQQHDTKHDTYSVILNKLGELPDLSPSNPTTTNTIRVQVRDFLRLVNNMYTYIMREEGDDDLASSTSNKILEMISILGFDFNQIMEDKKVSEVINLSDSSMSSNKLSAELSEAISYIYTNVDILINKLLYYYSLYMIKKRLGKFKLTEESFVDSIIKLEEQNLIKIDIIYDFKFETVELKDKLLKKTIHDLERDDKKVVIIICASIENHGDFEVYKSNFKAKLYSHPDIESRIFYLPFSSDAISLFNEDITNVSKEVRKIYEQLGLMFSVPDRVTATNKNEKPYDSNPLVSSKGTLSFWFRVIDKGSLLHKMKDIGKRHRYFVSALTGDENGYKSNNSNHRDYKNAFGVRLSYSPDAESIRFHVWISNDQRKENRDVFNTLTNPDYDIENFTSWNHVIIRWDKDKSILELNINNKVVKAPESYTNNWPEIAGDKNFYGTWSDRSPRYYLGDEIEVFRFRMMDGYQDDNWIKEEQKNNPSLSR